MTITKEIEDKVARTLRDTGAHLRSTTGHFVGTSGIHTANYINCDALFPETQFIEWCAQTMVANVPQRRLLPGTWFNVVIGIGRMGELLAREVAKHLGPDVVPIYAEKKNGTVVLPHHCQQYLFDGAQVLVVDDVFTTGKTVKLLWQLVTQYEATVVGISVLVNRNGGKTVLDGISVEALYSEYLPAYPPDQCPLCRETPRCPIFTDIGHGAELRRIHEYWPSSWFAQFYP